jgi:hypothetical protein
VQDLNYYAAVTTGALVDPNVTRIAELEADLTAARLQRDTAQDALVKIRTIAAAIVP